mmetsp:Transcript_76125/g.181145  ORF Transcript_76125/g.181145 Transcript_76125/m.181145 type:complete len:442 (-) Transcript_76125:219-1544(-)
MRVIRMRSCQETAARCGRGLSGRRRSLHLAAICGFWACVLQHLLLHTHTSGSLKADLAAVVLGSAVSPPPAPELMRRPLRYRKPGPGRDSQASPLKVGPTPPATLRQKPAPRKSGAPPRAKFRFGAISDVQFADIDDAWNFRGTELRRYRSSLEVLRSAIQDWRQEGAGLDFIVDLGDMIDQQCETLNMSERALAAVLGEWQAAPATVHHLLGNHELYNFDRSELEQRIGGMTPWYRSFEAAKGWRVIILDPYDVNAIEMDRPRAEQGLQYLSAHNPNDLRAPRGTVNLMEGLEQSQRRFVPMGGAVGTEQIDWLRGELRSAASENQRCILLTHLPLMRGAAADAALLWNYEEVLDVIKEFSTSSRCTVPLVLSGHDHKGGYSFDNTTQTHHVTLPSPLSADETCPHAHATIEVWDDRIQVHGKGLVKSLDCQLTSLPVTS